MFKKVWIAALAVVVGLVALGFTGTKAGGLLRMKWQGAKNWAAKQVTPETEIALINDKLDRLGKEDRRFVDQIVRYGLKVEDMQQQVATSRVEVKKWNDEVRDMYVALKTDAERVSIRGGDFSRAEVQKQVRLDAERLQRLEARVKTEEAQLKELIETRDLYEKRLADLRAERESMRTELARIQNALLTERLAGKKCEVEADDGGLSSVRQDIRTLNERVRVMTKTREMQGATDEGPVRRSLAEKERQDRTDAFLRNRFGGATAPVAAGDSK